MKGYGIIAKPLTTLLKKHSFEWITTAQHTFDALKEAMATTPVLALSDFQQQLSIETDAFATGIGIFLQQTGNLVAFYSKALGTKN